MDEMISRQAVLKLLSAMPPEEAITKAMLIQSVQQMDAAQPKSYREGYQAGFKDAQPERKRGTWIIKDNPGTGWYRVTCSECGEDVASIAPCIGFYPNAKVTWDYCPNCGAEMREVDDERPD